MSSPAIRIHVQNPMNHTTPEGKFTSYLVVIETENLAFSLKKSNIRRRFSEFVWLRDTLAKNHPDITPPSLPKKTYFKDRFDANLIEDRKVELEAFLKKVTLETRYLSDNAVHLFLQSPLSVHDIAGYLENPAGRSVATLITAHQGESLGQCPDCEGSLYPDENGDVSTPTAPSTLPGVPSSDPQPCPHDIFSPTRPHSFDFSHCLSGGISRSYDSSDESATSMPKPI